MRARAAIVKSGSRNVPIGYVSMKGAAPFYTRLFHHSSLGETGGLMDCPGHVARRATCDTSKIVIRISLESEREPH